MPMTEVFTLGRDAVLREAGANNTAVCNLALAYTYGRDKDEATGRKPTQWIEGTLWGVRAKSLAPYMLKGSKWAVTLEHVHIAAGRDKGDGSKYPDQLKGEVIAISQVSRAPEGAAPPAAAPRPAPAPPPRPAPTKTGFDDMDDDIPF